jgi:release factor glutamine methyltransferase
VEVRTEPRLALDGGDDGLRLLRRIIAGAGTWLEPGGGLFLEAEPEEMAALKGLLDAAGWTGIETHKDLAGDERVISAQLSNRAAAQGGRP